MLKIRDDIKPLVHGILSTHIEMGRMGFFEPGVQRLSAQGIGPCFVFVAFYQKRPLAIYYWGGPSSDNTLPLERLIDLELDRFRFKIVEKREALALPDFEEEYPDGDEPIDILPIGGQRGSQAIVDIILGMSQDAEHRILSTNYLNLTVDMDSLDLFVDAQETGMAAITLRHVPSNEHSVREEEEEQNADNTQAESSLASASAVPIVRLFKVAIENIKRQAKQMEEQQMKEESAELESPSAPKKQGLS